MTPSRIILHHSLTKDSSSVSWQAIRRYHLGLGWENIGYHFGIEKVGKEYEIFTGRMITEKGAHTRGRNHDSLGICIVGNFDKVLPNQAQWDLALRLVRGLMSVFNLGKNSICGHNQFSHKTCPGTNWDMDKFREEL